MSESHKPRASLSGKIPLKQALSWIILSTIFISGSLGVILFYYKNLKSKQRQDPAFQIIAIVQTSPDVEGLKTVYLAELMDLSVDKPTNLYSFNSNEALQRLLECPVIKQATIRKIRPGTVHVDYSLRKPIAFLGDFANTAIDKEGYPFPFKPFFTPKKLPEICLGGFSENDDDEGDGKQVFKWGGKLTNERIALAFELLDHITKSLNDESSTLCSIDVSKAFALSYGQRQIVLIFEERKEKVIDGHPVLCLNPCIVRLDPDNFRDQLANYLVLRTFLREHHFQCPSSTKETVVKNKITVLDLRLADLAFIASEF